MDWCNDGIAGVVDNGDEDEEEEEEEEEEDMGGGFLFLERWRFFEFLVLLLPMSLNL